MIDDQLQRAWHFKQLKWSLQALARAGSAQPTLFPEESPKPDDLAFGFDHWAGLVRDAYGALLPERQSSALEAIARKLETMSRDGAEFDVELWTEAALSATEHWADVRLLAVAALDEFGWGADNSDARPDDAGDEPDGEAPVQ
jgi:hypothetical protein